MECYGYKKMRCALHARYTEMINYYVSYVQVNYDILGIRYKVHKQNIPTHDAISIHFIHLFPFLRDLNFFLRFMIYAIK